MIFMFVCAAQNIKSFLNMKFTGGPTGWTGSQTPELRLQNNIWAQKLKTKNEILNVKNIKNWF